jgi:HlyD family secretion protein
VVIFGDLSRLRVRAEIDETHTLRLRAGQAVEVRPRGRAEPVLRGRVSLVKQAMGPKTVFAQSATERSDLGVIQVLVDLEPGIALPVGFEVDVKVEATGP